VPSREKGRNPSIHPEEKRREHNHPSRGERRESVQKKV
jgi:hypothetical protein